MWLNWTWDWLFVLAGGVALSSVVLALAAGLAYSRMLNYFPGVIVGAGLVLYSLFEGIGITRDPYFLPYAYASMALVASLIPWMNLHFTDRKHGTVLMFLPLFGLVVGAFAFSQAFPDAKDLTFGCYGSLAVKWAFAVISVFSVLVLLSTGLWAMAFALKPGRMEDFRRGMILSAGSLFFAVSIVLQSISDCKLAGVACQWGAVGALMQAMAICMMPVVDGVRERHKRQQCEKNLEQQQVVSIRDPLTGLFNRGYFFETLNWSIERLRRDGDVFGLVLIDIDDFKHINDRMGHPAGDYCLSSVGKVIMHSCRAYDCPARYGGDEFIVLVTYNTNKTVLEDIATRMHEGINNLKLPYNGKEISIKATMGAMLVEDGDLRPNELLQIVDDAMYKGKQQGKARMVMV